MAYSTAQDPGSDIPPDFYATLRNVFSAVGTPTPVAKPATMTKTTAVRPTTGSGTKPATPATPAQKSSTGTKVAATPAQPAQKYTTQTRTITTPGSDPYTQIDPAVLAFLQETGGVLPGWLKNNVFRNGPKSKTVTEQVPVQSEPTPAPAPAKPAPATGPMIQPPAGNPNYGVDIPDNGPVYRPSPYAVAPASDMSTYTPTPDYYPVAPGSDMSTYTVPPDYYPTLPAQPGFAFGTNAARSAGNQWANTIIPSVWDWLTKPLW